MTKKMNPVVHFEMPADDQRRVAEFYAKAFGWDMEQHGPEMGNYVVATTTEVGENGRPKQPGAINGGFYPKGASDYKYPSVVIAVEDITQAMKDVEGAGGEIIGKPTDIPGVGMYVSFYDSERNRVSLLQPSPQM